MPIPLCVGAPPRRTTPLCWRQAADENRFGPSHGLLGGAGTSDAAAPLPRWGCGCCACNVGKVAVGWVVTHAGAIWPTPVLVAKGVALWRHAGACVDRSAAATAGRGRATDDRLRWHAEWGAVGRFVGSWRCNLSTEELRLYQRNAHRGALGHGHTPIASQGERRRHSRTVPRRRCRPRHGPSTALHIPPCAPRRGISSGV